jgi:hypothetical protein
MVRGRLLERWRAAMKVSKTPVDAWGLIVEDQAARRDYQQVRGMGGFVRSTWDEVNQLIAAANVYTIKKHGPDRVVGFSPIPAMSMVSYAAGSRYLSLIGGVCMSFYDWYCDLPPASPQVWGEQTDVPESADWYNSTYIMAWGSNVPQTRTPDAHFFTEVRYKGTKTVAVSSDYGEMVKFEASLVRVDGQRRRMEATIANLLGGDAVDGRLAHRVDGVLEDLASLHRESRGFCRGAPGHRGAGRAAAGNVEQLRLGSVGPELGGKDASASVGRGDEDGDARSVTEKDAGVAVVPVDKGAELFRADDEGVAEGTGPDRVAGELHRIKES